MTTTASRIEVQAFAAMMTVSLPFPPLPIMCSGGAHGEDAQASSHDLLSCAISAAALDTAPAPSSEAQRKKLVVLVSLGQELSALWKSHREASQADVVDQVYNAYSAVFRGYMSFYLGCADLRMMPLASVDVGSRIHSQAVQHLNAQAQTFETQSALGPAQRFHSYHQLLAMYSQDLAAETAT